METPRPGGSDSGFTPPFVPPGDELDLDFLSNSLRHREINTTLLSQLLGQSSSLRRSLSLSAIDF